LERVVQRISYTALLKSCMIVFTPQLIITILAPLEFVTQYRFLILATNIILSGSLGWKLYNHSYHMVFSYDDEKFTIRKGKTEQRSFRWEDFEKVSVARSDYGEFMVRLYDGDDQTVDIPVSKLKLDPFNFRFEVIRLVESRPR